MYDRDGEEDDLKDLFGVLVSIKTCPCLICCACVQFQIEIRAISGSFILLSKTLEICHLTLFIGDVLVAVANVVFVRSLLYLCLRWFYKAAFTRQTKVRKLKLVCVNSTKQVAKTLGNKFGKYSGCEADWEGGSRRLWF